MTSQRITVGPRTLQEMAAFEQEINAVKAEVRQRVGDKDARYIRTILLTGDARELPGAPAGVPDSYSEHMKLLFDLQVLALQGDLENHGGLVACHSGVRELAVTPRGIHVESLDGTRLLARTVVNAAGLHACDLARKIRGFNPRLVPKPWYAKGSYFTLAGRSPFTHLIYPTPEPDAHLAGLGVHLTLDLGGQAKFGPDVQWVDSADDLVVDPRRGDAFYAEVRKYWPALPDGALVPGYAGIRPKIHGPGEPAPDFCIQGPQDHGIAGLVNLFGIESPGLTSSLAIADHVAKLLGQGG